MRSALLGLAAGVAAYPTLSRLVAEGKPAEARRLLTGAVRSVLVLAFAAQVAFTAAGPEISEVVYGARIDGSAHRTIGTALALQVPIVGQAPLRSLEQLAPMGVFFGLQLLYACELVRARTQRGYLAGTFGLINNINV